MQTFKPFSDDGYKHVEFSKSKQIELHTFFCHSGPQIKEAANKLVEESFSIPFFFTWGPGYREQSSYSDMTESMSSSKGGETKRGGHVYNKAIAEIRELINVLDLEYEKERISEGEGDGSSETSRSVSRTSKNGRSNTSIRNGETPRNTPPENKLDRIRKERALKIFNEFMCFGPGATGTLDLAESVNQLKYKNPDMLTGATDRYPYDIKCGSNGEDSLVKKGISSDEEKEKKGDEKNDHNEELFGDLSLMDQVLSQLNFEAVGGRKRDEFAVLTSAEVPQDLQWMEDFMKEATIWKFMYGMVPYYATEDSSGSKRLFIPNVYSGYFVGFLDEQFKIQCYWKFDENGESAQLMSTAHVYIWPLLEPLIYNPDNPFNSAITRLMDEWYTLTNTKENMLIADYLRAHAPVAMVNTEKLPEIDTMSADDIFTRLLGITTPIGSDRTAEKLALTKQQIKLSKISQMLRNDPDVKKAMMNSVQTSLDPSTFHMKKRNFGVTWPSLKMDIDHGKTTASLTLPESPKEYLKMKDDFLSAVELTFGVSLRPTSSLNAKTTKGAQALRDDQNRTEDQTRRDASLCLEECFTVGLGKFEDDSINSSLDTIERKMSDEYRVMKELETYYGEKYDNPLYEDYQSKKDLISRVHDVVSQKAWEAHNIGLQDGIYTDQRALRRFIKDKMMFHMGMLYRMNETKKRALAALKMKIRLKIIFRSHLPPEAMDRTFLAMDMGLIDKKATSYMFNSAQGLPLDIPMGDSKEEKLMKLQHELNMETAMEDHKFALALEKIKAKTAQAARTSKTSPSSSSSRKSGGSTSSATTKSTYTQPKRKTISTSGREQLKDKEKKKRNNSQKAIGKKQRL